MTTTITAERIQHELNRIHNMTDNQLSARYDKMSTATKIEAFHEALVQTGRAPHLRKRIAKDLNIHSVTNTLPTLDFMQVIENTDKSKKAIFQDQESGRCFLYSYVKNEVAHETMVFNCLPTGDINDYTELVAKHGYVPSSEIMGNLAHVLMNERYDETYERYES